MTALVAKQLRDQYSPGPVSFRRGRVAPLWKVERGGVYVNYTGGDASSLTPVVKYSDSNVESIRDSVLSIIEVSLKSQGFRKLADRGYNGPVHTNVAYGTARTLCSLTDSRSSLYSDYKQGVASLRCGTFSKYTTDLDSFKKSKPFVEAFKRAGQKIPSNVVVEFADIQQKDSATPGYQVASVDDFVAEDGGVTADFWRKKGGAWTFFGETQMGYPCSQYNTADLKAAYAGEDCWEGSSKQSTVKP